MAHPHNPSPRQLVSEAVFGTSLLILVIHGILRTPIVSEHADVAFTIVALYLAWALLRWRRRPIDFIERSRRACAHSLRIWLAAVLLIFPTYLLAAHGWQTLVADLPLHTVLDYWPPWSFVVQQLVLVALPEECFFRGYVHSTLDRAFGRPWKILGAPLGWGWIVTAALFATCHSLIAVQWWHFAIFFPGLLFGYLRARTNGLIAPILFHTTSNLLAWFVAANYGG